MTTALSISRLTTYFRRHGLGATVRRLGVAANRALFSSRSVLFFCDLPEIRSQATELPSRLEVERHNLESDVSREDLQEITSFWNPELARRNISHRFELGASLWLIRFERELAGYGWTLQGRTVEPHYFPLGQDDVQFLDFHVFPKYRGRALDWFLMTHILYVLAAEGRSRAYGEAGEWNKASIASFGMTPFRCLGWARKYTIFGRTIVWWDTKAASTEKQAGELEKAAPSSNAGARIPTSRA